ncbi:MAG: acyltransferase [Pseudomonadota bacterium]
MTIPQLVRAAVAPASGSVWELTELDRANHFLVLRGTWLFAGGLDAVRLEAGLRTLLGHYPQYAGRMREGRRVLLDDCGVPLTHEARTDLSVAAISADHALARRLHPRWRQGRVKRGLDAPLAARLTELPDGQALSVTATHACGDGRTFYGFVRDWGRCCRGEPVQAPVLDQALVPPPLEGGKAEVRAAAREAGWVAPDLLRGLPVVVRLLLGGLTRRSAPIHLDTAFLDRLRAAAGPGEHGLNDRLTAHLSRACARLVEQAPSVVCRQAVVLDGRGRLAGVPEAFAGNAAMGASGATFAADDPLPEVVARTHTALSPWLARPSATLEHHVRLARAGAARGVLTAPFDLGAMHTARPTVFYVNSFVKMPVYDVDFGTPEAPVRPLRAIPHDLPDPILLWPAPPDRGGVELYLTGRLADALARRGAEDAWWRELMLEA